MKALFVYITCSNHAEAETISKTVVHERLAACANIMAPQTAIYRWEGAVQTGEEVVVILKTKSELFERLCARIVELHSYDVPCIVALSVEAGHEPFLNWIHAETLK